MEIYVPIPGYQDSYMVSNIGNIKTLEKTVALLGRGGRPTQRITRERIRSLNRRNGYLVVDLWRDATCKVVGVHRLVYDAFIGPIPSGFVVHHVNGDRTDNRLSNLMLVSHTEHHSLHSRPAWNKGLIGFRAGPRDKSIYASLRKPVYCLQTGVMYGSVIEAASSLGISSSGISDVLHGRRTHVGGYAFVFREEFRERKTYKIKEA